MFVTVCRQQLEPIALGGGADSRPQIDATTTISIDTERAPAKCPRQIPHSLSLFQFTHTPVFLQVYFLRIKNTFDVRAERAHQVSVTVWPLERHAALGLAHKWHFNLYTTPL